MKISRVSLKRKVMRIVADAVFVWKGGLPAATIRTFSTVTQMRIQQCTWEQSQCWRFWWRFCSWHPFSVDPSYLPFSLPPHSQASAVFLHQVVPSLKANHINAFSSLLLQGSCWVSPDQKEWQRSFAPRMAANEWMLPWFTHLHRLWSAPVLSECSWGSPTLGPGRACPVHRS